MANVGLLEKFANPETMMALSSGDKMTASLMVTVLGMGITFAALLIIWGVIALMSKILAPKPKNEPVVVQTTTPEVAAVEVSEEDDEELIAVITAAVAASMNTSIHNIVVRNIVRSNENSTAWSSAGRVDRINANL
ncbi:MAG: OadG family protein [Firmicutes bacterium]|jgi:sodium pump decarboxylase gamma subunit|nr:OadG family protein [Bacillota bacterium]